MSSQDVMPDQFVNIINNAFSKYGAGDIKQVGYDNYFQELSRRIVAYEIQTSWYWIYGAIAFIILSLLTLAFLYKKRNDWVDEAVYGFGICAIAVIIISAVVIFTQLNDIATCNNFPEKIVWQYVRDTLKNLLNSAN